MSPYKEILSDGNLPQLFIFKVKYNLVDKLLINSYYDFFNVLAFLEHQKLETIKFETIRC